MSSLRIVPARRPSYRLLFAEHFPSIEIADQILLRHCREERIHLLRERSDGRAALSAGSRGVLACLVESDLLWSDDGTGLSRGRL